MNKISRRTFVFGTVLVAAGARAARAQTRKISPNEKLNVASVGAGGQAEEDVAGIFDTGQTNIVALCDVDWKSAAATFQKFPNAEKFKDFRKMLEKLDKDIDAVSVTIPDHMHFAVAKTAMEMGKHVRVQKPLTRTVYEARRLTDLARKYNVVTQMGNQGHSEQGVRRLCEWIWSGAIGNVREVHMWTDRPIWPQGGTRPEGEDPIPDTLDWDLWLGVAPKRPYKGAIPGLKEDGEDVPYYCPFTWRGWWDFGCGALGDMACHIMDPAYTALKLKYPKSIEATSEGLTSEMAPKASIVTYEFEARGDMPPVKLVWYDGGKLPPRPEGVDPKEKIAEGDNGSLFIGDKGMMACGTYGGSPSLVPAARMKDFKRPERTIPKSPGVYKEWVEACKGNDPHPEWRSRFEYAGPFTEMVLLGNLAIRCGKKVIYDPVKGEVTNVPEANPLLKSEYREGWTQYA